MRVTWALAVALVASQASGCMLQNLSSNERLRDAIIGYNDECRWGRTDLAVQRVAPAFRGEFRRSHLRWGRSIQIADHEVVNVEAASGEEGGAVSFVNVRWFTENGTYLAESMLQQTWNRVRGGFVLVREEVVDGDARLLAAPAGTPTDAPEDASEDGDAAATDGDAPPT